MTTRILAFLPLVLGVSASACVSVGKYDAAVKRGDDAHAALTHASHHERELLQRVGAVQSALDDAATEDAMLRDELRRLGTDADTLLSEKGVLATQLGESRARLEELRRAQAAAEARASLYRELAVRLQKMVDAGELSIALRDGRMVLQLPNDVLFDSGQVDIKPRGQAALKQLGAVIKTIGDRHFQVAGHTDNVPIDTPRFASNWELSTARGVEVVRFLVGQGVAPQVLAAAGYGEFDPIAANDSPKGRSKNRRIEITLQPNVNEMVAVPEAR